jgi:serine/threonine protein kinase
MYQCIYAMLGQVIFGADEDLRNFEAQGVFPHIVRLQRQVSFFGHREGLKGLITHVSDEEVNCQVLGMLWDDRTADYHSYRPFSDWPNVTDEKFKDLIRSMTNLDPRKRVTAREALEHPWFSDCEINGVGNRDIQDATSITAYISEVSVYIISYSYICHTKPCQSILLIAIH